MQDSTSGISYDIFNIKTAYWLLGRKENELMITEEVKRQHEAFWHQEAYGRCCLYLTAPKAEAPPREKPRDLKQMWEDIPWRVRWEQQGLEDTLLLGDAIPSVFTNFGPGCLAACVGGTHKWSEFTVWFENEPFFYSGLGKSAGARTESAVCYVPLSGGVFQRPSAGGKGKVLYLHHRYRRDL